MRWIILLALMLGATAEQSPPEEPPVQPTHEASGPPVTPGQDTGDPRPQPTLEASGPPVTPGPDLGAPPVKAPHTFVYLVPIIGGPTSDR